MSTEEVQCWTYQKEFLRTKFEPLTLGVAVGKLHVLKQGGAERRELTGLYTLCPFTIVPEPQNPLSCQNYVVNSQDFVDIVERVTEQELTIS